MTEICEAKRNWRYSGCQRSSRSPAARSVRTSSACRRESFFLAASRLAFAALPLNSVAPNEKKSSGTQGKLAREIQLIGLQQTNLSNRSSGVQIPRDICTRFGHYFYSTSCSWR